MFIMDILMIREMVNGGCGIVVWMMLSVGILPMHLSFEHTGITFYGSGSYSRFLSTQDWRTHKFRMQQNEMTVKSLHTHAVLHSSLVPWRDSIIIIINNKKHNLSQ